MSQTSEPAASAVEPDADLVAARMATVLARWGDRLDGAARATVEDRVRRDVQLARELRSIPLANGDEPEIVFVPFRADAEAER